MDETRTRLYRILNERLNDGELRTLCFSLGVEYDDLPGQGKADKARELIAYLDRRHNLAQLAETLRQQRPDISVPEVPDKPGQDLPDKESVSSRNLPRAKYRWGALIGLGGLAIGIIAFVVTVATNKKPAAPTPPTAASLSAAPTLSATFTPTSLPIEPTVTHPPIEAPLDWTQFVRLSLYPACGNAHLLPPNIDPSKDATKSAEQFTKIIDEWVQKAWLAPTPYREFTLMVYATVTGLDKNKEWVKLDNKITVVITSSTEIPAQVNLSAAPGCGGGGKERAFSDVALSSKFDAYSTKATLSDVDYLSLQPGEFEDLAIRFKCASPGVYQLALNIPFAYAGKSGLIRSSDIPTVICPESFTYWDFSLSGSFLSSQTYQWNDGGYRLVP